MGVGRSWRAVVTEPGRERENNNGQIQEGFLTPCCCDTHESGLYGLGGLNGLMGALVAAGSEVKVGFAYNIQTTSEEAFQGYGEPSHIQEVLRGALLGSGLFSSVAVIVNPEASIFRDGYILIQGTLYTDQVMPEEIGNITEDLIREYLPTIQIKRRDPVHVLSAPANRPEATRPFDPTRPGGQQNQLPGQPGECNWSQMSFGDYVACQLGIKSPLGGVGVGAAGALVGVGVITLLAVVLLKR